MTSARWGTGISKPERVRWLGSPGRTKDFLEGTLKF